MRIAKSRNIKTAHTILSVGLLILAAGCASDQRESKYTSDTTETTGPAYTSGASSSTGDLPDADRVLASTVRIQFDRYGALSTLAQNIQIGARNGTVTLAGSVPGEQERKMIQAMVANTKGVLMVDDQLRVSDSPPLPFNQGDRALVTRVRQSLGNQPTLAPYTPNIDITADRGVVTLAGSAASQADRQMIENTVRNTTGVAGVIDRIQAPLEPTGRPDQPSRVYAADAGELFSLHVQALNETDRVVAQQVLQGLRTDTVLTSLLPVVNINVAEGKVTLRGTVQSDEQRRTIVAAVQRSAGAGNVFDELQVHPPR